MLTYKRIYKKTITTTNVDISSNPKRIGLTIQNISGGTLYVKGYQQQDNDASRPVQPNFEYVDKIGASAALSLQASASTDVRIEEIIRVGN